MGLYIRPAVTGSLSIIVYTRKTAVIISVRYTVISNKEKISFPGATRLLF